MLRWIISLVAFSVLSSVQAQNFFHPTPHNITILESIQLKAQPDYETPRAYPVDDPEWQPSMDDHKFRYVLVSGYATNGEAQYLKETIAKNLPKDMKMVVLVKNVDYKKMKSNYTNIIASDKIIFATNSLVGTSEWARDAFPVPVIDKKGQTSLIGAKYYRDFYGNQVIADAVQYNFKQFKFTFVGGNILADENGSCFVVNSPRLFNSKDTDFKAAYGCKGIHFMKHLAGIGDIDEVLKPIANKTVLTNRPEYVDDLKSWGYKVILMPSAQTPSYKYRTYMNSLLLNGIAFMPTYGVPTDAAAKKVYESLGYKVVGIPSNELSDRFFGSVHCQTMAYPAMNENELFSLLNLQSVR